MTLVVLNEIKISKLITTYDLINHIYTFLDKLWVLIGLDNLQRQIRRQLCNFPSLLCCQTARIKYEPQILHLV